MQMQTCININININIYIYTHNIMYLNVDIENGYIHINTECCPNICCLRNRWSDWSQSESGSLLWLQSSEKRCGDIGHDSARNSLFLVYWTHQPGWIFSWVDHHFYFPIGMVVQGRSPRFTLVPKLALENGFAVFALRPGPHFENCGSRVALVWHDDLGMGQNPGT